MNDKERSYLRLKRVLEIATYASELLIKIGVNEDKNKKPKPDQS